MAAPLADGSRASSTMRRRWSTTAAQSSAKAGSWRSRTHRRCSLAFESSSTAESA